MSFIRQARRLGFSIPRISALLELWQDQGRSSADVNRLVETHLDELRERIGELQGMVDTMQHLVDRCDGDKRPDCPILQDLERSES